VSCRAKVVDFGFPGLRLLSPDWPALLFALATIMQEELTKLSLTSFQAAECPTGEANVASTAMEILQVKQERG
jgi:hypothetical protein